MKGVISVRVIPNAKKEKVQAFGDGLKVYLTAVAQEGKANKALLELLAAHFKVRKSQVTIIKGQKSRNKLVKLCNTG